MEDNITQSLPSDVQTLRCKRSGMTIDRACKIQARLKSRVGDVMSCTRYLKLTHTASLGRISREVYDTTDWKNAPHWVQSYIRGYHDALREEIYRTCLEWRLSVDGVLLNTKEVDALTSKEVKELPEGGGTPGYKSPRARCDSEKSHYTYIGCPDKIY